MDPILIALFIVALIGVGVLVGALQYQRVRSGRSRGSYGGPSTDGTPYGDGGGGGGDGGGSS